MVEGANEHNVPARRVVHVTREQWREHTRQERERRAEEKRARLLEVPAAGAAACLSRPWTQRSCASPAHAAACVAVADRDSPVFGWSPSCNSPACKRVPQATCAPCGHCARRPVVWLERLQSRRMLGWTAWSGRPFIPQQRRSGRTPWPTSAASRWGAAVTRTGSDLVHGRHGGWRPWAMCGASCWGQTVLSRVSASRHRRAAGAHELARAPPSLVHTICLPAG